jgi:hypothetical protein
MTVYANGLEVSCKAQSDRVIAAFPDVCFTPPENPATPPGIPVPYPTFGFDTDTDKGTGTVKIGGQTINQKNKSYYTKTTGTEAGCAAKKGIINSKNTGKKYNRAWSSNVKADKEPVCRFTDITTNNHACEPPNAPTTQPLVGGTGTGGEADTKCLTGPYEDIKAKCNARTPKGQAHHVVPDKAYRTGNRASAEAGGATVTRAFGATPKTIKARIDNAPTIGKGICICISSGDHTEIHRRERGTLCNLSNTGTAPIMSIVAECMLTLDDLDCVDEACIEEAKGKVREQTKNFKPGQQGRTTDSLPTEDACTRMCP